MSNVQQRDPVSYVSTEAIAAFLLMKPGATAGTASVNSAGNSDILGVSHEAVTAAGRHIAAHVGRVELVTAADTFALGATLYAAAAGRVTDTPAGDPIGMAAQAAGAAGAVVEVRLLPNLLSILAHRRVLVDGGYSYPMLLSQSFADSAGDVDDLVAPCKLQILDAWIENQAANGANANTVQVCAAASGASAVTDAISLNAKVDTDVVRAAKVNDANAVFAAAAPIYLNVTKAGGTMGGVVRLLAVPVN